MAVSDEQHLLMTFPEDKIAHQTRVTLPGITAQSLGRKSDDTDQSCLSSNSLKVSKNITPILESLIIEFNQIALLTHTNNFKIEFFLGLLEGLTPPKAASCFSKLYNLCSHRSEVKLLSRVRLCDPMDCSLPRSSVHRIFQARVLEWVAISFSRVSSQPRD